MRILLNSTSACIVYSHFFEKQITLCYAVSSFTISHYPILSDLILMFTALWTYCEQFHNPYPPQDSYLCPYEWPFVIRCTVPVIVISRGGMLNNAICNADNISVDISIIFVSLVSRQIILVCKQRLATLACMP